MYLTPFTINTRITSTAAHGQGVLKRGPISSLKKHRYVTKAFAHPELIHKIDTVD